MITFRRFIACLVMIFASSANFAVAESLKISPRNCRILFEVDAVGWPTTKGAFKAFQGTINVDFDNPKKSAVSFSVQSASVDAGSSSVTNFIRSESMLNTNAFSEMRFLSTNVEKLNDNSVRLTGNMTFMGQTRVVNFQVDVDQKQSAKKQLRFSARGTLKRSEFGFVSGQPLISDDVRILVTTEAEVE
jgi:polyisoprenoid-binding protein YceI